MTKTERVAAKEKREFLKNLCPLGVSLYPGDVVGVTDGHPNIPDCTLVNYIGPRVDGFSGGLVEYRGIMFNCFWSQLRLYRRHIDSPHRAEDDKRFWKLHPPTKRAKGAK